MTTTQSNSWTGDHLWLGYRVTLTEKVKPYGTLVLVDFNTGNVSHRAREFATGYMVGYKHIEDVIDEVTGNFVMVFELNQPSRDHYQELRNLGLTHDQCDTVLEWAKTVDVEKL